MVMFFSAVSGQRVWSWAMTEIRSRSTSPDISVLSSSFQRIVPESGVYSPASSLASVVSSEPFSPTSAMTSPRSTATLTPASADVEFDLLLVVGDPVVLGEQEAARMPTILEVALGGATPADLDQSPTPEAKPLARNGNHLCGGIHWNAPPDRRTR